MVMTYGSLWASAYGDCDDGAWLDGLRDLKLDDIRRGVEAIKNRPGEFPPSLPEFRRLCKPGPACHKIYRALPKPKAEPEKVKTQIEKMREALSKST